MTLKHISVDIHLLMFSCKSAFIVVKIVIRNWNLYIFVKIIMTFCRHPVTMRSVMVHHEKERLFIITCLKPLFRECSYKISNVTVVLNSIILCDKFGIVIVALSI